MHDVQPTNTRYTGPKEKGTGTEERSHKESLKKMSVEGTERGTGSGAWKRIMISMVIDRYHCLVWEFVRKPRG
jgi:hypothetical protein